MKMLLKWTMIALLLAAAPVAQAQERTARIGYLSWKDSGPYYELTNKGFIEGLRDQGYVEGRNLVILRGTADYDPERFKPLARILKGKKPADLPIEEFTEYQLSVSRPVATRYGLSFPLPVLLRAETVIE